MELKMHGKSVLMLTLVMMCGLYLIHIELAHYKNNFRQDEIWAWDLYHSTALFEEVKSLTSSNVKEHGEVPYQKPQQNSMAQCISAMHGTNSK